MRKLILILREAGHLVWQNKLWFMMPILVSLALLAFLVYTLGPTAMIFRVLAGVNRALTRRSLRSREGVSRSFVISLASPTALGVHLGLDVGHDFQTTL